MTQIVDIREYVFPLFVARLPDNKKREPVLFDNQNYLGTGFFISKNGVALTAGHCAPVLSSLGDLTFIAGVWDGTHVRSHSVVAATSFDACDIAILKINHASSKYFPISFQEVKMGEDVMSVGIPEHSLSGSSKEFRCLKGHVTFVRRFLELSFAAPRGMSGSPVLVGSSVVAVLSGNARSETLEDQIEETMEEVAGIKRVKRVETRQVVNYGLAESLTPLKDWRHEICADRTFEEFIRNLNARDKG